MYVVLDTETTGGRYNKEAITEIAMYKFDGETIVDTYHTLVNPQIEIQEFVVQLTGITNEMVKEAPTFEQIAQGIEDFTKDAVLVAHNASFDYRMLTLSFARVGMVFERKTLCTVELCKIFLPEEPSHSLGKLSKSLGISLENRHRATGDALATVSLLSLFLSKVKSLDRAIEIYIKELHPTQMSPFLVDKIQQLPSRKGVFLLYNNQQELLYVEKTSRMRYKVNRLLKAKTPRLLNLHKQVSDIKYYQEECDITNDLYVYQYLESHRPRYNFLKKRFLYYPYGVYYYLNKSGYWGLYTTRLGKANKKAVLLASFFSRQQANKTLKEWSIRYNLCDKFVGVKSNKLQACKNLKQDICHGACLEQESKLLYNLRVKKFINQVSFTASKAYALCQTIILDDNSQSTAHSYRKVFFIDKYLTYRGSFRCTLSQLITYEYCLEQCSLQQQESDLLFLQEEYLSVRLQVLQQHWMFNPKVWVVFF